MNIAQPILAALLFLAACGGAPTEREAPLDGAPIGGPFELVNAAGETVTEKDFADRWQLIYFGYTFCPDICPVDVQRMGQAYAEMETAHPDVAERLQPIFVSIDPERDTPEIAQEFASSFNPAILGLSGSEDQVAAAAETFLAYRAKGEVRDDGFYLMDHSAYIYLIDPDGRPITFYDRTMPPAEIASDIREWMTS